MATVHLFMFQPVLLKMAMTDLAETTPVAKPEALIIHHHHHHLLLPEIDSAVERQSNLCLSFYI
jgi:hypothetical protein